MKAYLVEFKTIVRVVAKSRDFAHHKAVAKVNQSVMDINNVIKVKECKEAPLGAIFSDYNDPEYLRQRIDDLEKQIKKQ